jgi:hypothetical protein
LRRAAEAAAAEKKEPRRARAGVLLAAALAEGWQWRTGVAIDGGANGDVRDDVTVGVGPIEGCGGEGPRDVTAAAG